MKMNIRRLGILLLLLALSVGFGYGFDAAATAVEKHRYPKDGEFSSLIEENAARYGIPESVLWATISVGSGFASNAVSENGAIGLMQITPACFEFICSDLLEIPPMQEGMLYEPSTNLQCGAARLSYLYEYYNVWDLTYAAYYAGTEQVDEWLNDPAYTDENGILKKIPDKQTAEYVNDMKKAVKIYVKLYFEP